MSTSTATATLARFIAASTWPTIPAPLRHEAKRALLNHLGCALGVAQDPELHRLLAVTRAYAGPPTATVIAQRTRLDPLSAAFLNAIASNLLDYDDTHLATVIHPAAPVAPAALALAEHHALPGEHLLHALLLGAETACRIGLAVSPGHYARGWHITATCGVFGAAAAASKLLNLTPAQTTHALGIAASQSAGLVENLPTAAKNVGVGNAARHGILSALLAREGLESAPTALEGPLGWARAMGDTPDLTPITENLGTHWEFARNTYKPYPAGIVFHAVIDAARHLRATLAPPPDAITSITVEGDALLLARGDRPVHTHRDARVSIHHCAALGLLRGTATPADFSPAATADPALASLRTKTTARLDPTLPRGAARITLHLTDGTTHTATVTTPRGSLAHPLTDTELEAKFRDNATAGDAADRADALIAAIWSLDTTPTAPLATLLA